MHNTPWNHYIMVDIKIGTQNKSRVDEKFHVNTPCLRDKLVFWRENKLPRRFSLLNKQLFKKRVPMQIRRMFPKQQHPSQSVYARICRRIWHEFRIPRRWDILEGGYPQTGSLCSHDRNFIISSCHDAPRQHRRLPDRNYVLNIPHAKSSELSGAAPMRIAASGSLNVLIRTGGAALLSRAIQRSWISAWPLVVTTFIATTCDRSRCLCAGPIIRAEVTRAGNYV